MKTEGTTMNEREDDAVADEIVSVFTQAIGLLRQRGLRSLQMETEAMDLLMDHATLLGPEGLADVLSILALDRAVGVVTRTQAALAVGSYLETRKQPRVPN